MTETTKVELRTGTRELRLPIRFVSDWHMGHPASLVQSLGRIEPLLDNIGTLVMVGDGREEIIPGWEDQADSIWEKFEGLCQSKGVDLVAMPGNHDPDVSGDAWMFLRGRDILVTHGDMIFDETAPWSRELFENEEAVTSYLSQANPKTLEDRWKDTQEVGLHLLPKATEKKLSFFGAAKRALWPPRRLLGVMETWRKFVDEGDRFLERFSPSTTTLICGHFHRLGKFDAGSRTIYNLGSLMKFDRGGVIDFDGAQLCFRRVESGSVGFFVR